jgi:hypothetical protein
MCRLFRFLPLKRKKILKAPTGLRIPEHIQYTKNRENKKATLAGVFLELIELVE